MEMLEYCPDCGIKRTRKPKPGTCPCCYSKMDRMIGYGGMLIYSCSNISCKRCVTSGYLSGFWASYREFVLRETHYPNGKYIMEVSHG